MADIPEGTIKQHPNGGTYMRQGGVWVLQGGAAPAAEARASTGVLGHIAGAPKPVDPYKVEDQNFQRAAASRAESEFEYRRQRDAVEDQRAAAKAAAPPKDPKVTEGERAAAGYLRRAVNAHQQYGTGIEPLGAIAQTGLDMLPNNVANGLVSPERRAATNFADEFIRAKLRKESGAAIPTDEMAREYRVYFPVPGDTQADLERKAGLREEAINGLRMGAGSEADAAVAGLKPPSGALPEGEAPPTLEAGMDTTQRRVMAPGTQQGVELNNGEGPQTVDDPTLAGLNSRINAMLKSGKSIREVASYIENAGIPLREVMPSLQQIAAFRKKNPNYRGDYNVNIDDKLVPMGEIRSAIADASSSPLAAGVVASVNTLTGNHLDNIVGAAGGNAEIANIGMGALREQNQGASLAGDLVGGVGLYGAGRAVAGGLAARGALPNMFNGSTNALSGGAIAGDAALGAYIGSGEGTDLLNPMGAIKGAATAGLGGVAGRGAINTVGRAVAPTGGRMAPLYAEGVQPTIGQRMGGAAGRFEEANTALPFVGGVTRNARNNAIDQAQRGAFNQALREIGTELPKGVSKGPQAHAFMQRAFNQVYDKARSGMQFKPDGAFTQDFGDVLRDVDLLPAHSQNVFKQLVMPVGSRIKARGGLLTGNDYKLMSSRIDAKVRAIRKNQNGDGELADALERFSVALDDGAKRHSPPEAVELLNKADRGYVRSVIIENAAKGGGEAGEFSGKALERAIKSGAGGLRARTFLRGDAPMQEYAGAMSQLGDVVGDSGTIPRLAAVGGAGAMGAVAPQALIPSALSIGSNAPVVRQAINAALSPNRARLAPVRKKILDRARLGGLFGISLAESNTQ